ncbi:hypothetical protein HK104_011271 [Borealophlyctis nickersoniae]|nr:hypothetical protein HK104_011271 [Borealophlyctis nickersoniae]
MSQIRQNLTTFASQVRRPVTPHFHVGELLRQPVRGKVNVPFEAAWRAVVASVTLPQVVNVTDKAAAIVLAGLAQGLTIMSLVAILGKISGGHINPAITLCLMVVRSIDFLTGLYYIIFQFVGAVAGAALFQAVVGYQAARTMGSTTPVGVTDGQAFLMEFMISSMLMFAVLGTALHSESAVKPLAPIPIGFTVTAGVLIGGLVSGGSMNPARTFGPAVISNTWTANWLYWIAPFTAALVVGILYKLIFLSMPVTVADTKDFGLDLGQSGNTLNGDGHANMGAGVDGGARYMTQAQAIDMRAASEEIQIVTEQPRV